MSASQPVRQRLRKGLLVVSLLLFPITMNYLSPYLIIESASLGIVNGSMVLFGLMFISSLFFGRIWCGWACPGGAIGDLAFSLNQRPITHKRMDWIKWFIWAPWVIAIFALVYLAGGFNQVDLIFGTVKGISVAGDDSRPITYAYIIYYLVVLFFLVPALFFGRRAGCHALCWMSPFMILGRKLRNIGRWYSIRLLADPVSCKDCLRCNDNCPMSLDVNAMVKTGRIENSECIFCLNCIDSCQHCTIRWTFSPGR
jgi:polyferredoxin